MKKSYRDNQDGSARTFELGIIAVGALSLVLQVIIASAWDPPASQSRRDEKLSAAPIPDAALPARQKAGFRPIDTAVPGGQARPAPALFTREVVQPDQPSRQRISELIQAHFSALHEMTELSRIPE